MVTGVRTRDPALSFACSDQHALALEAFEKAVALGYRRPALVLDGVIDELVEGRFTAGFLTGQSRLSPGDAADPAVLRSRRRAARPRGVFQVAGEKPAGRDFHALPRSEALAGASSGCGCREDIGLIQYEWRADHGEWAGMDQRNDLVGEAAMDMLISMVHHNERGVPEHPRATMIGCHWVDGATVEKAHAGGMNARRAAQVWGCILGKSVLVPRVPSLHLMITLRHLARFAAAAATLLLASCANQKPAAQVDKDGKPINPYPAGTYDHFKAEPTYPKTHSVWKNEELLSRTDAGELLTSRSPRHAARVPHERRGSRRSTIRFAPASRAARPRPAPSTSSKKSWTKAPTATARSTMPPATS